MNTRLLHRTGFATALLLVGAMSAQAQGSQCLPADANSANLISVVRNLITTTNPRLAGLRDNIGLGGVDTAAVVLVTDRLICAKAVAALDKLANVRGSGSLVYVVQAGPQRYVVRDPGATAGEYITAWVFDTHFRLIQALLQ